MRSAELFPAEREQLAEALAGLRLAPSERDLAADWLAVLRSDWSLRPPWLTSADVALLHRAALVAGLLHLARAFAPLPIPKENTCGSN
ncbi:hypothetical protein [Herbaspirillum sp.]|jgi:hypothetical protein|uniref:hypothetical protein n=1 Tax=Herbaspirillum sp. TaxID=1890675 RepID=UPI000C103BF4|nr:hypothetical protein [Herbaspirillum sp.]MBO18907.1 hypothetical protein [Herbaspirillum sp.]|tara:strand:- start:2610 stop:2873 length:264 start_codon:yes stop_codon:yes gene_type:complete